MKQITKQDFKIDKRFELLEGIVCSYVFNYPEEAEEYGWINNPAKMNNDYLINLSRQIDINKYPLLLDAIRAIKDEGWYTNLFLYFDNDFNYNDSYKIEVFENISNLKFARELQRLYNEQNMKNFFEENEEEYIKMLSCIPNDYVLDITRVEDFYKNYDTTYDVVISSIANGGFCCHKDNYVCYYRGLRLQDNNYYVHPDGLTMCAYHEYSHLFVNPIVDKYMNEIKTIDSLFEEAKDNGLPRCYQNKKTYLYELFVRANEMYLSKPYIEEENYIDNIDWIKEMSWYYIEDILEIIETKISDYDNYEELFVNKLIPYMNTLTTVKTK